MPDLKRLHSLYKVLRAARDKRGAIDFETVETRIIFDEQRKIDAIVPVVRNDAHKLIEECMLCANVAAADFSKPTKCPCCIGYMRAPAKKSWRICASSSVNWAWIWRRCQAHPRALPGLAGSRLRAG